jgi:hypothetical protein
VFGEPAATEELEDVGWHPIGREALGSFRDVTRFMLARAIALRDGTASGAALKAHAKTRMMAACFPDVLG